MGHAADRFGDPGQDAGGRRFKRDGEFDTGPQWLGKAEAGVGIRAGQGLLHQAAGTEALGLLAGRGTPHLGQQGILVHRRIFGFGNRYGRSFELPHGAGSYSPFLFFYTESSAQPYSRLKVFSGMAKLDLRITRNFGSAGVESPSIAAEGSDSLEITIPERRRGR